ncbi:MAG: biotin/lipoyl-containing protein, partial [Tepidiformaceae bacterium]
HAIEFRINAEDPWDGFKPSTGRVAEDLVIVNARCDVGFESGDLVPTQYDSLVAKAIFRRTDRLSTLRAAKGGLEGLVWGGTRTNLGLHATIIDSEAFRTGAASIDWFEANLGGLLAAAEATPNQWAAAAAGTLPGTALDSGARNPGPFKGLGWIGAEPPGCWLDDGVRTQYVRLQLTGTARGEASVGERTIPFELTEGGVRAGGHLFGVSNVGRYQSISIHEFSNDQPAYRTFHLVPPPQLPRRARAAVAGVTLVAAPLAGTISGIRVTEGDAVETGKLLVLLEAMKMEHRITAPNAGTVKTISVHDRDVVHEGDTLVELS